MSGRLDDCWKDDIKTNQLAKNLLSLSETQATLAQMYQGWSKEGGERGEQYAKEAKRLAYESGKYAAMAEREMNNG